MLDFDIILGMDWLRACFASIDCRTRVVRFNQFLSGRRKILFLEVASYLVNVKEFSLSHSKSPRFGF